LRAKRVGDTRELTEKIADLEARLRSAQDGEGKDRASLEDEIASLKEKVRQLEDQLKDMHDQYEVLQGVPGKSIAQFIRGRYSSFCREYLTRSMWSWNALTMANIANQSAMEHQYKTLKKESACRLMAALRLELYRGWQQRPFVLWARGQDYDIVRSWQQ